MTPARLFPAQEMSYVAGPQRRQRMSEQQAHITYIGPGYVQFDTTPTDEQIAEAWRLLADLDRAMAEDESGDDG